MRIGLLTSVPETLDAFFLPWMTRWEELGHQVFSASGSSRGSVQRRSNWRDISGLTQNPRISNLVVPYELNKWQSQEKLDLILTNTATASLLARTQRLKSPVVYFCHGLHWGSTQHRASDVAYKLLERSAIRNTAGVITMNQFDRDWFIESAPNMRHLHLDFGIGLDLHKYSRRPAIPMSATLKLLWVGSFTQRKRPLDAVAVAQHLVKSGVGVELVMMGDGPLFQEALIASEGLDFIKIVNQGNPVPRYNECHAVVHTSRWEGLSRVLLEAAAIGRPSFGYQVKGVVDAPGTITRAQVGDVSGLANSILEWRSGDIRWEPSDASLLDWRRSQDLVTDFIAKL